MDQLSSGDNRSNKLTATENPIATTNPRIAAVAAVVAGAIIGTFEIANTSVGWHLASGRWVLDQRAFLRTDPFSMTPGGAPWIDHEWLFQVGAALLDGLGGAPALVIARALTIGLLALLLLLIGTRSGLTPPVALVFAVLCVVGARPRFFLRPELVTLLIVPTVVWLFLERGRWRSRKWLFWLGGLMIIGANAHGATLVVPILLGGVLAAETSQMAVSKKWDLSVFASGAAGVLTAGLALLVNPYGWHLYGVPFKLAHLVDQAHIPNPEWIPPTFSSAPVLYLVIGSAILLMGLRERRAARWILLAMAAALALRHIRNLGLFYVLLPLALAPSLSSWRIFGGTADRPESRRRLLPAVSVALLLGAAVAISPYPRFGFGFARDYYPDAACQFLDREGLPANELYNDVGFGGYLIDRYAPSRLVFQDDRNEIHESLLREIWEIFEKSDVRAWSSLLSRYDADTALVRYHPSLEVSTPDGRPLGERGFSALWFPRKEWALVYWDDVAMVFVRREGASSALLENHEYTVLQPDDMTHVAKGLAADPQLIESAARESERALKTAPTSQRALEIAEFLESIAHLQPTESLQEPQ